MIFNINIKAVLVTLVLLLSIACGNSDKGEEYLEEDLVVLRDESDSWPYSYVDDSITSNENGADGIDIAIDEDGNFYTATAWQDSNAIRVCRSNTDNVYDYWECVTVGTNTSPEFAFFASIFNDRVFDVISCGQGGVRLHIAPDKEDYLNPSMWQTYVIPISVANGMRQEWNEAAYIDVDEDGHPDIIAGGDKGIFGWFKSPEHPLHLDGWEFYPLVDKKDMRWEMGVHIKDMDGDGDIDVIVPDRGTHTHAGVSWFENPGEGLRQGLWPRHDVILRKEVRMIDVDDIDGNGFEDVIIAAKKPAEIIIALRLDESGLNWDVIKIPVGQYGGYPKDVDTADIDGDGKLDIVVTTVDLKDSGEGIFYLSQSDPDIYNSNWEFHLVNPLGAKDDNLIIFDFDADGDLDIMTSIEIPDLGLIIFWNQHVI